MRTLAQRELLRIFFASGDKQVDVFQPRRLPRSVVFVALFGFRDVLYWIPSEILIFHNSEAASMNSRLKCLLALVLEPM